MNTLCIEVDEQKIAKIVENEWNRILEDALQIYLIRQTASDYSGFRDITQALTTIASICAWRNVLWT